MSRQNLQLGAEAKVNQDAADEVVKAYYPAVVSSADTARGHAQTAYTIASAVAAAIVAAGVFGGIDDASGLVKVLALASVLSWLIAAGGFMSAVAGAITAPNTGTKSTLSAFVTAVIENARHERRTVVKRAGLAMLVAALAMVLTVGTVAAAWLEDEPDPDVHGTFRLTRSGAAQLTALCGAEPRGVINASVDPGSFASKDEFVALDLDAADCGGTARTLRVRRRGVVAFLADAK